MRDATRETSLPQAIDDIVRSKSIPIHCYIQQLKDDYDGELGGAGEILDVLYEKAEHEIEKAVRELDEKMEKLGGKVVVTYADSLHSDLPAGTLIDVRIGPAEGDTDSKAPSQDAIPDFRTVKPESHEEDELQRVFEVMLAGGKRWDLAREVIDFAWESNIRKETANG
jgi:hypothetical protein